MDAVLFEQLLYEEESDSLDFKRDQYPFNMATDDQKRELLKDILAFANSWKRSDAYILIGVDDVKGGKSNAIGIMSDLDDAKLQQFVNTKTNRPIAFSYEVFIDNGKRFGVIKIPVQQRPFYITKDYGKLEKEKVYICGGNSTAIAKLDEIAIMGTQIFTTIKPSFKLEFANVKNKTKLGNSVQFFSNKLIYDENEVPSARTEIKGGTAQSLGQSIYIPAMTFGSDYPDYYLRKVKVLAKRSILHPLGFWIKNSGDSLATNVSIKISIVQEGKLTVMDEVDYPEMPPYSRMDSLRINPLKFKPNSVVKRNRIDVLEDDSEKGKIWKIVADFGDIRPKDSLWSNDIFYIGAYESYNLKIEAILYADNLPEPIAFQFLIDFNVLEKS